MEYDGFSRRPAGRYSVLMDLAPKESVDSRCWRCDECGSLARTHIIPVECECGGEYCLAPIRRKVGR